MGEVGRRNVPLRGWQRADLSNGEEAMVAARKGNSVLQWKRWEPTGAARKQLRPSRAVADAVLHGPFQLYLFLPLGLDKRAVSSSKNFFFPSS